MKKNSRKYFIILSFVLPIMLILIDFVINNFIRKGDYSFSSRQILVADLKSQYLPLFNYLRNVLQGNESIFYSFHDLYGGNMIGTFAYYLSSPLNLLLIFSSSHNLTTYMFIIILIKIGLCGLTMNIFLFHKKSNNYASLMFSLFYALMAYNLSYYFNLMWLDCIFLVPLILYGIDNIIHKDDGKLYLVMLSYAIISNFYIAYMVCIFSVIYFIYELIISFSLKDKKIILKIIKKFIVYSLLSVLICSFIIIPTLYNLLSFFRIPIDKSSFITDSYFNNFLISISRLYIPFNESENLLSLHTPNIYFGILPLLFVFTFFYGKFSNKEKYITLIIIIFFFLSLSTNNLNIFWHAFSLPNGYAYRFSFLFSLFMLIISYKSFVVCERLKVSKFLVFIFLIFFVGMVQINNFSNIYFCYFSLFLTLFLVLIYYLFTWKQNKIFNILLFIAILIELCFQVNTSFLTMSKLGYEADYNYYLKKICSLSKKNKDINYRFDSPLIFGGIESFSCNDDRITGAISTNNSNIYKFMYNMGYSVTYSTVLSNGNTLLSSSLLGINKYLDNDKENYIDYVKYKFSEDDETIYYLHENKYALPLGYVVDSSSQEFFASLYYSNAFEFQNNIINSMTGKYDNVLIPFSYVKYIDNTYQVDVSNGKDIYINLKYVIPENDDFFAEIIINDEDVYEINSFNTGILKIKNEYDDVINVSIYTDVNNFYDDKPYFYYLDEEILEDQINCLNKNVLKVNVKEKNYLKGTVDTDKDGILFLSIPFEKGWNIYIDNKKVEYYKIYDAFIGIDIKTGSHKIKMVYYPPGLSCGIVLSIGGIIITTFMFKNNKKKKKKKNK